MTAPGVWADQTKELTVEDMENMPDDEFRYELDDGMLIAFPVPSVLHQLVVLRLAQVLDVGCPPELEAIIGVGVHINRYQHPVPDVAVVRGDSMDTVFQERPPALVVEVPRRGPGYTTGTARRMCTSGSGSFRTGSSTWIWTSGSCSDLGRAKAATRGWPGQPGPR